MPSHMSAKEIRMSTINAKKKIELKLSQESIRRKLDVDAVQEDVKNLCGEVTEEKVRFLDRIQDYLAIPVQSKSAQAEESQYNTL